MSAELHIPHEWTTRDLEALPDDGYRYEIVDGQLLVTPPPTFRHQLIADRYCRWLRHQGEEAVTAVGVVVPAELNRQESFVIPDVVAVSRRALDSYDRYLQPSAVRLAVEVISPSTRRRDRVIKKDLYAEMGFPRYVLVDMEQSQVQEFALLEGDYIEVLQTVTWEMLTRDV